MKVWRFNLLDQINTAKIQRGENPSKPSSETSTILIAVQNSSAFEPRVLLTDLDALQCLINKTSKQTYSKNVDRNLTFIDQMSLGYGKGKDRK